MIQIKKLLSTTRDIMEVKLVNYFGIIKTTAILLPLVRKSKTVVSF